MPLSPPSMLPAQPTARPPPGSMRAGKIVGGYAEKSCNPFAGMVPHGFFLDDGNFTTIDVTRARGINNRGQIVGEAGANCFLLDRGTVTTIKVPFAGVRITFCSGIND